MISVNQAIEVFARGFSFTRSFTHPYRAEQIENHIWVMRDAPRRRGDYRSEEYIACAVEPSTLDATARQYAQARYRICAILPNGESDEELRAAYKALGYRLMTTEAFMVHDLKRIPKVDAPVEVVRVTTRELADALAKTAGRRQILPEHLEMEPAPMRQYVAMAGGKIVGWVGSVSTSGCAWCTNMFVAPEYRRRGIAKALMTKMLQDDRRAGAQANVLLASHAGAKLYPVVGYKQIGTLFMFVPQRRR
jgi:GNAT superfamily N-acetyltransferase